MKKRRDHCYISYFPFIRTFFFVTVVGRELEWLNGKTTTERVTLFYAGRDYDMSLPVKSMKESSGTKGCSNAYRINYRVFFTPEEDSERS